MTGIKTYANMNHEIKKTLGFSSDHTDQYALARIIELEMENQKLKDRLHEQGVKLKKVKSQLQGSKNKLSNVIMDNSVLRKTNQMKYGKEGEYNEGN